MQNDQFDYLRLLRSLSLTNEKTYDERDFVGFRPSFEYLISRETKSCQHCRSLIYSQTADVSNLSMIEILNARYFPKVKKDKTAIEVIYEVSEKFNSLFGESSLSKLGAKSNKEWFENSCKSLKDHLKISDSILKMPIFHRCNKCYKVWNTHLEMKRRFLPPYRFNLQSLALTSVAEFSLPKVEKFYQGIIFLNEKTEEKQISSHIIDIKKAFIEDNGALLQDARKHISSGDVRSAINNLISFTNRPENKFYYNPSLQLQSRYSSFLQEKLRGTLSHQEENLHLNRITSDTITLIDEILKYKNM